MDKKVMDVMRRGVITCRADETVEDAARMIVDNNCHLLVIGDEAGEACGVITRKDIFKGMGKDLRVLTVEDIMTSEDPGPVLRRTKRRRDGLRASRFSGRSLPLGKRGNERHACGLPHLSNAGCACNPRCRVPIRTCTRPGTPARARSI
jgi:hypothetical protein